MRLLGFILGLALCFTVEARQYQGNIAFGSNSVTTAYELVLTNTKRVKSLLCSHNTTALSFWLSIKGAAADCSDATDDVLIGEGQGFGVGPGSGGASPADFEVGKYICLKTVTGTSNTADTFFNCLSAWEGVAQ